VFLKLFRFFRREPKEGGGQNEAPVSAGDPSRRLPEGVPIPKNVSDIWHILQKLAEEEDVAFAEKNVVEHYNTSAEALKDIQRWIHIYQRRVDPLHSFRFPAHYQRYRGYCLVPRVWPDGLSWDAFHEETWFRAPLPRQPDVESLKRALDSIVEPR
jgi:hypothetical protein